MRTRSLLIALSCWMLLCFTAASAYAAPMARILRIDPRASVTEGGPVLTLVVDLTESKRLSDAIAPCAGLSGNAQYDCQSEALEKPGALFTPFPYPEKNANFLVTVDGAAQPTRFVSKARWGDSQKVAEVGTAWLIVLDASSTMGNRFDEAKAVAAAFVNSMGPNDIVNVMAINDQQVVKDSKWIASAQRGSASDFISGVTMYQARGRDRALSSIIRGAVNDGFNSLGNTGSNIKTPLHQALVVLSNGSGGSDAMTSEAGALTLQQYFSKGRFPEDNSALPKTPLPVISIWFPQSQLEELMQKSQGFMMGLANTEIGGFYTTVRQGQAGHADRIVGAVRDRFNHMHIVKYSVSCIASNLQQTFNLVFSNVKPMIGGDATFKEVPIGIDPTTWPLDVNTQYTVERVAKSPVHPGGTFRVYGNFCWGGDKSRAEVYFLPKNQPAPASVEGGDIEGARRAQQQLIAMNMRGKPVEVGDTFAEFEAPDSDKILLGSGDKMAVRLVIYDNKARRTSPVDANHILTLKAEEAPFPFVWIGAGAFGFLVLLLLVVAVVRGGGGGKRGRGRGAPPPAPVVAGGPQPQPYGAPQAQPYGAPQAQAYGAPQPSPYQAPQAVPQQPQAQPYAQPQQPPAPQQPGGDFMYGGQPPQYGLTGAQPAHQMPPPDPYAAAGAAPAHGGASRAVISGSAGTYPIFPGADLVIGRDSARCQAILQEPRISAVHATVHFDGAQVYVRDEGSNNGSYLNGNRLSPGVATPVPPGSILRFGPVEFVVRLE